MDCMEFRKSLLLHLGRQLSPEEERQIHLHRKICRCCDRRASYEERFQVVVRGLLAPIPSPSGLRGRIRSRLAASPAAVRKGKRRI